MAEDALVSEDIDAAGRLIAYLDAQNMPIKGAMWLYDTDAERWRFVIAFREKREDLASFYIDVAKLTNNAEADDLLDLSRVQIVDSDKSIFGALHGAFHIEGNSRVRVSHNRINGVYLEDALVYRLSA
jgi:hypothetical protein